MFKRIGLVSSVIMIINSYMLANDELNLREKAIKVFYDCEYCVDDNLKKELSFVNYVRDSKDAHVHIINTREMTGAGGVKTTIYFIGQQEFAGQNDTLQYSLQSDYTYKDWKDKQVQYLKLGLIKYISKTPYAEKITIHYTEGEISEKINDKWNSWIFSIGGSGSLGGNKTYSYINTRSNIEAKRVTEKLKVEFSFNYNYNINTYVLSDTTIISNNNNKNFTHLLAKSINDKWSYGYDLKMHTSLFQNIDLSASIYPVIEYNIFPYSESNRRQFCILYGAGGRYQNYIDSTIYNKMQDLLLGQKMSITYEITEKWGSIYTSLEGSNYLHNFRLKRFQLYTYLNLRLYKGLSLYLSAGASILHDQINLPKGDISKEDVLIRRKQIASQYEYWSNVGLRYSFGSIYNNVVNPRLRIQ